MGKVGRPSGPDSKKESLILTSIAFLSGRETYFLDDEQLLFWSNFREYIGNLSRKVNDPTLFEIDSCIVPKPALENFVKRFFGIDRKTVSKHMKELTKQGAVKKKYLPIKGHTLGYFLQNGWESYLSDYKTAKFVTLINYKKELDPVEEAVKNPEFNMILEEIFSELPVNGKLPDTIPLFRAKEIFDKYPFIRLAFLYYRNSYWNNILPKNLYEVTDDFEIKKIGNEIDHQMAFAEWDVKRTKHEFVAALTRMRDDIIYNRICSSCLVHRNATWTTVTDGVDVDESPVKNGEILRDNNMVVRLIQKEGHAHCSECGYTARLLPSSQDELTEGFRIAKLPPITRGLRKCTKCDFDVPPQDKTCPNCGSKEIEKRRVLGWEPLGKKNLK